MGGLESYFATRMYWSLLFLTLYPKWAKVVSSDRKENTNEETF